MGTRGTERGCSWSYVPFLTKKRVWVHAESRASPAQSARTVFFAHATTNWCPHHLPWCLSTSNHLLFVPVRSGRSVLLPNKKRGATLLLPLRRQIPGTLFFSGCTESNRFPKLINTIHAANSTPFILLLPMLSGGG